MYIEEDLRQMKNMKQIKNNGKKATMNTNETIVFNSKMRKTFVEGVLQDIKGMFEQKTDGKVAVTYADYDLKNREFGFRMLVEKTSKCSKQMWSEAASAIVNVVNYMFPTDGMNMDVSISTEDTIEGGKLEVEIISCW